MGEPYLNVSNNKTTTILDGKIENTPITKIQRYG